MRVGFIGTGTMGSLMAKAVLEAGHDLLVFDIRREATDGLTANGATYAEPKMIANQSDAIFASLPGPKEVEEVIFNKIYRSF